MMQCLSIGLDDFYQIVQFFFCQVFKIFHERIAGGSLLAAKQDIIGRNLKLTADLIECFRGHSLFPGLDFSQELRRDSHDLGKGFSDQSLAFPELTYAAAYEFHIGLFQCNHLTGLVYGPAA